MIRLLFVSLIFLSGCAEFEAIKAKIDARQAAEDDHTCVSYGLKFGTAGYAECRELTANRRQAAFDAFQVSHARVSTTCHTTGETTNCDTN